MEYWYIWYTLYENGKPIKRGRHTRSYRTRYGARACAKRMFGDDSFRPVPGTPYVRKWIISETNPWKENV